MTGLCCWLLGPFTGCVVLAPLDTIQPSTPTPPSISAPACDDAPCMSTSDADADSGMSSDASPLSQTSDPQGDQDGGKPAAGICQNIGRASIACDPVHNCGCGPGLRCEIDDSQTAQGTGPTVACLPLKTGHLARGDACERTSECSPGLMCSTKLCAPYCATSSDCSSPEGVSSDLGKSECLFLVDQQRNVIIPGTGSCQTPCDPLVATACAPTGKCTPAPAKAGWIFPSCFPVSPTDKQDGEACSDKETCTTGLGCGQYGPRVCTRYCLVDADCSADRPLCHTSNLTLGSGESLGQCVAPCDDAHLSGEPQWTAGPVWTKEWFEPNCEDLCGSASYRCYRDNCPGGARYYECFTASRNALATAPSGVCRDAYVKATCVDDAMRTPSKHMLDGCLGLTQYDEQAHKQCVSGL